MVASSTRCCGTSSSPSSRAPLPPENDASKLSLNYKLDRSHRSRTAKQASGRHGKGGSGSPLRGRRWLNWFRILRLRLAADCRFLRANLRAFFPSFLAIAAPPRFSCRRRADGGGGFRVWISFSTPGPLTLSGPGSRACPHVPGPARSVAHMVDGPWALPDLGSSFSFVLGGATRLGFPWALLSSAQAQHRRLAGDVGGSAPPEPETDRRCCHWSMRMRMRMRPDNVLHGLTCMSS